MRPIIAPILIALLGAGVMGVGGIGTALTLENQDAFCASCHTEPESVYYQRSLKANASDLASYHTHKSTRCIDCHSGAGLLGRADGLRQGSRDLAKFLSGTFHRPAVTLNPLGDASCTKCHSNVLDRPAGRSGAGLGHYHFFLPQWRQIDSQAVQCVSCHSPHTIGLAGLKFMAQGKVGQLCDACHEALSGVIK
jgi:predicted CXXCH cytochrome family protein